MSQPTLELPFSGTTDTSVPEAIKPPVSFESRPKKLDIAFN
jgi:hypothetical protein